jgi:hypothetical protein
MGEASRQGQQLLATQQRSSCVPKHARAVAIGGKQVKQARKEVMNLHGS